MPNYLAHYSVGEYGKVWFKADSFEHAEKLLAEVLEGEMLFDDLPNMATKPKGDELEIEGLEELP
jgi:hypothetical protein